MAAYLRSLRATDLVSSVKVITTAPDVFPVGVTPLTVSATDSAGTGVTQGEGHLLPSVRRRRRHPTSTPGGSTRIRVTSGDHRATLTWVAPRTDFAATEVHCRRPGVRPSASSTGAPGRA